MSAASEPIERRVTSQRALNLLRNNPIFVAIALLVIITSVVEPKFLTAANFDNILRQFGTLIFAALGMTFVIMAGFLDLSIGGIISLVACYHGLKTTGGTEGVGNATTRTVVAASILILVVDYFLTQILLAVFQP